MPPQLPAQLRRRQHTGSSRNAAAACTHLLAPQKALASAAVACRTSTQPARAGKASGLGAYTAGMRPLLLRLNIAAWHCCRGECGAGRRQRRRWVEVVSCSAGQVPVDACAAALCCRPNLAGWPQQARAEGGGASSTPAGPGSSGATYLAGVQVLQSAAWLLAHLGEVVAACGAVGRGKAEAGERVRPRAAGRMAGRRGCPVQRHGGRSPPEEARRT